MEKKINKTYFLIGLVVIIGFLFFPYYLGWGAGLLLQISIAFGILYIWYIAIKAIWRKIGSKKHG